jgi:hypothetical protein
MILRSLLFSRDQETVALVVEVLNGLEIEVTPCSVASEAVEKLASTKFNAIIVDTADARGAVEVMWAAKSLPTCESSIGVVLATSRASIGLPSGGRSHMVLYRPLSADRLRSGIKSVLRLRREGEDARESQRAPINIPATLRGPGLVEVLAFITNLSAGGAALRAGQEVPSSSIHSIEFILPGEKDNLSTPVELVWRDVEGHVGIRFVSTTPAFTESLEKWLGAQPAVQLSSKASA